MRSGNNPANPTSERTANGTDQEKGYAWENVIENSWEKLDEDEAGQLLSSSAMFPTKPGVAENDDSEEEDEEEEAEESERLRDGRKLPMRKGIIRYVVVLIDLSKQMDETGIFRPNCLGATLEVLKVFVIEFFEKNPLSYIGICFSKEGKADVLTRLSSSKDVHLESLKKFITGIDFSLQNGLLVAYSCLKFIPKYFSREIIVLQASLSTCDPGDIFETIETLRQNDIRCSFVSLSAEVYICKKTTELTNGTYTVAKSKENLHELLLKHLQAPDISIPSTQTGEKQKPSQLKGTYLAMGFPSKRKVFCFDETKTLAIQQGFECPRCLNPARSLPTECNICGLHLIDSSELTKSYHHLSPVSRFKDLLKLKQRKDKRSKTLVEAIEKQNVLDKANRYTCGGCSFPILQEQERIVACPLCFNLFCGDCDQLIHDSLYTCPQCC